MSELIRVPDIGNGEGEVIELLVKIGDRIEADQSLLTLESDKASMEIPAPKAGVIKSLKIKLGDKLKTGDELLELEAEGAGAAPADAGNRVAHLVSGKLLDYIELEDDFTIVKMRPPREVQGFTIAQSQIRKRYGVTILGVKSPGEDFVYATEATRIAAEAGVAERGSQHRERVLVAVDDVPGRQVLVGKVDRRLEMGERTQAHRAPVLVQPVQRAIHLLHRLAPLLASQRNARLGISLAEELAGVVLLNAAGGIVDC